ncbi:hypothetical protein [Brucella intermedia]|uniref:Uncharacterized protein n=1 Tax=Brucella intermedia M86 TaxID=1234597 RepID=M5JU85_9HYPH|nr:hypothetical protein [Brucella intermedia]ELT46851.1 hypothetical protein D584_22731 [Brucella intermedia M86]
MKKSTRYSEKPTKEPEMTYEHPTREQLREVLSLILDIAEEAGTHEGIPTNVDQALDKIVSLARYEMNVMSEKSLPSKQKTPHDGGAE